MTDPYKTLGLASTADKAEIKKTYRRLVKTCHPDRHPDDPKAAERFRAINEAYELLESGQVNTGPVTSPAKPGQSFSEAARQRDYGYTGTGAQPRGFGTEEPWVMGSFEDLARMGEQNARMRAAGNKDERSVLGRAFDSVREWPGVRHIVGKYDGIIPRLGF